jgi:hypothetical protein
MTADEMPHVRHVSRTWWPDACCEFIDAQMCAERAIARITSRAEPSEHLWCCRAHAAYMLRVDPADAYVSWLKPGETPITDQDETAPRVPGTGSD